MKLIFGFLFSREGNNEGDDGRITYAELLHEVCQFANVLKACGVKRGDHIAIYLPMILELPVAMLACARIGVVHSVVFGGFSAESLAERMIDGHCNLLVTAGKPTDFPSHKHFKPNFLRNNVLPTKNKLKNNQLH